MARRVRYHVDPSFPGPGRFKGEVRVNLTGGQSLIAVEEYNRGSAENPMSESELRTKFDENASGFLSPVERVRLAEEIERLDHLPDSRTIVDLAVRS